MVAWIVCGAIVAVAIVIALVVVMRVLLLAGEAENADWTEVDLRDEGGIDDDVAGDWQSAVRPGVAQRAGSRR